MKKHISPSQISMYLRCGEQYRRRYVHKDIIPPGIVLIKGSSVHRGAEHNFRQKIQSQKDLNKTEIIEVAVDKFEDIVKTEGVHLRPDEEKIGKKKVVGEAKDRTVGLADLYAEEVAGLYQPTAVEEETTIEIPTSEWMLKGIIDVETADDIMDLKVSGKSWDQKRADKDPQMTFYSMMVKAKTGKDKVVKIENLVDMQTQKRLLFETRRDKEDYQILINRINRVIDGVEKGNFPPAPVDSWACDERYCGYALTCPFYRKTS